VECSAGALDPEPPEVAEGEIVRRKYEVDVDIGLVMGYLSVFIALVIASGAIMCWIKHKEKRGRVKMLAARASRQNAGLDAHGGMPMSFAFTAGAAIEMNNTEPTA